MKRRMLSLGVAAMVFATWSTTARADGANGFGEKGQLILSADRLVPVMGYSSETTTTKNDPKTKVSESGSSIALLWGEEPSISTVHTVPRIAFDFTIIDRLTLGGSVVLAFGLGGTRKTEVTNGGQTNSVEVDTPSTTVIGLSPRVGYILPFGDVLAFWPRGGLSFYSVRSRTEDTNANVTTTNTDSTTLLSLDLDPQLAIVPLQHFFFNVGPLINIPLTGSRSLEQVRGATTTTIDNNFSSFHIGISAGLGGWFNL